MVISSKKTINANSGLETSNQ